MMRRGTGRGARGTIALIAILLTASTAGAQQGADAVFARARQLVVNGNGAAGRLLIDSVMSANAADSPTYGEALYWRAALAASTPDAERDYRRLVVEFPFSSHAGDALLQLAQIENARGDRASASRHLERFLLDNPKSDQRPRAGLLLVRLLFEQNDLPRGCTALRTMLAEVPEASVETRNQLDYYTPRCTAMDATPGGRVPVAPDTAPARTKPDTTHVVAPQARYTLQIAAYKSKTEADALVKKLRARKIEARVVAGPKFYRVRVGKYVTRGAAVAAQRQLKGKKIDAVITDIGDDDT